MLYLSCGLSIAHCLIYSVRFIELERIQGPTDERRFLAVLAPFYLPNLGHAPNLHAKIRVGPKISYP